MSRKKILISIAVATLILIIVIVYVLAKQGTPTTRQTQVNGLPVFGGTTTAPNNTGTGTTDATNSTTGVTSTSKFHKLTDFSVAGATFFLDTRPIPTPDATTTPTTDQPVLPVTPPQGKTAQKTKTPVVTPPPAPTVQTVPALRYVDRATGHIFERYLDTGAIAQISNSTIPAIYEAFFDSKASTVIYRYVSEDNQTITSFMATLGASAGEFLPSNIVDVSISADGSKFFYLTKNTNGVTGTIRSFAETKKTQVFTSSFSEWLSQWVGNQKIYLTTKASYASDGNLFSLNTTTGTLTKIFGPIVGLTTLANSSGTSVLYSSATTTGPALSVLDVASHVSTDITPLYGLPEKCVWSSDNITVYCAIPSNIAGSNYPDSWYQGTTSFNDSFVKINTTTDEISTIADSNNETPVDGTHLFLDSGERELFFINKKDSTLWSLDLNDQQ